MRKFPCGNSEYFKANNGSKDDILVSQVQQMPGQDKSYSLWLQ